MAKKSIIDRAKKEFGAPVVHMVLEAVSISDPDGAWATFQDMGMDDHADCVEYIYFDHDE